MSNYDRELKKLMKFHNYDLIRERNHLIWKNKELGEQIVTPKTPRNRVKTILNIKREIRRVYRLNDNFPSYANDNKTKRHHKFGSKLENEKINISNKTNQIINSKEKEEVK